MERSQRQTEQDDLTSQETTLSELFVFQRFVANRSAADAKALLGIRSRRFHAAETRRPLRKAPRTDARRRKQDQTLKDSSSHDFCPHLPEALDANAAFIVFSFLKCKYRISENKRK